MFRSALAILLIVDSQAALAQSEAVAAGMGVGYVLLGAGAVSRIVEGPVAVHHGQEVRVGLRDGAGVWYLRGPLEFYNADSLGIVTTGGVRRMARAEALRVEALVGTERKWAQGWTIGLLVGAAVGGIGGLASGDDPPNTYFRFTRGEKAAILGISSGIVGSLVGAGLGYGKLGEHWRRVR